jgi:hypothetical protein
VQQREKKVREHRDPYKKHDQGGAEGQFTKPILFSAVSRVS